MNHALYAAASGMAAEQNNLDAIAGNLANADVAAFRGKLLQFATVRDTSGHVCGVVEAGTQLKLTAGKLERSAGPFDIALRGNGFFVVQRGNDIGYTRAGEFHRTADGRLENADGWHLPGVHIPQNSERVAVGKDGIIRNVQPGAAGTVGPAIGRVHVADFPRPEYLRTCGDATVVPNAQSGAARNVQTGDEHTTSIEFGMREKSNISIAESMMEILDAQRAYEADAKGVQAADEMVRIANNLQRG